MIKLNKFKKYEVVVMIILWGLVVFFVLLNFVIKPMQESREDMDNRFKLSRIQLMKMNTMLSQQSDVTRRLKHLETLIGKAGSEGAEMSAIVDQIQSKASETNVHIANMQPQRIINEQGGRLFPVELQVNGQWLNIVKFLSLVQSAPNYYFINEMNLEKFPDTAGFVHGRIVLSRMRLPVAQAVAVSE